VSFPEVAPTSMYTDFVRERRRCKQRTRTGEPCPNYAVWDDELGRCSAHGGRVPVDAAGQPVREHTPPCHCDAYAWPHRPASGLCGWPHLPGRICKTPLHTQSYWHAQRRQSRRFRRWMRVNRALWQDLADLRRDQRALRRCARMQLEKAASQTAEQALARMPVTSVRDAAEDEAERAMPKTSDDSAMRAYRARLRQESERRAAASTPTAGETPPLQEETVTPPPEEVAPVFTWDWAAFDRPDRAPIVTPRPQAAVMAERMVDPIWRRGITHW
jgi:hypothetical protein